MEIDDIARERAKIIGRRLVDLEAANPSVVKLAHNPNNKRHLSKMLSQFGYKKPLFQSYHDFVFALLFSDSELIGRFLPWCALCGPTNEGGQNNLWDGSGRYLGSQGVLQVVDFSQGDKDKLFIVIYVVPFFNKIEDLLSPVINLRGEK